MPVITSLHIYPIKSLGGISIKSSKALKEGLEFDRRWMLIDETGRFLTQRENAEMALFKTSLNENAIQVSHKNDEISIPLNHFEEGIEEVNVWDSHLKAQQVDHLINKWFSDRLKLDCKLVRMTSVSKRNKKFTKAPYSSEVSFADGYPYLILSQESMQKLNDKLDVSLNIDRFRANIIVKDCEPHGEDDWDDLTLGSAHMKVIKPCARCIMTTIDQETGEKGGEPLKTLATYRKKLNKIYFGANAIILKEGVIKVGDTINF